MIKFDITIEERGEGLAVEVSARNEGECTATERVAAESINMAVNRMTNALERNAHLLTILKRMTSDVDSKTNGHRAENVAGTDSASGERNAGNDAELAGVHGGDDASRLSDRADHAVGQ